MISATIIAEIRRHEKEATLLQECEDLDRAYAEADAFGRSSGEARRSSGLSSSTRVVRRSCGSSDGPGPEVAAPPR